MSSEDDFDSDDLLPAENDDPLAAGVPLPGIDLSDFDDEFDDDFEPEVVGEYELDDDEYARQLVDMVDFEIEGLSGSEDESADNEANPGVDDD